MPAATVSGFLLDQFGRPAVFGGQGNLYRRTDDDTRLRPLPPSHFADYLALLSAGRYRVLVSECRALAARGLVSALLDQKADYVAASGFRPRFAGDDSEYGAIALAELESALKICNLRGPRFDWRRTWRLAVPTRATDGRYFILLTQWGDSGHPALQVLEGHRIGQRDENEAIVKNEAKTRLEDGTTARGVYAGLTINNGIISTPDGTEVAYRVLAPDKADDMDISARDMIHVATPSRFSEGTAIPDLAKALPDFMALDTAQTCQLDQQIIDAKLTVIEKNASGRIDIAAHMAGMGGTTADGTPTEKIERGGFRYIKSGVGELSPWSSQRPSDQWMNFDARVASRAAAAIKWRVEMLDPTALRGAATRAFQDQINTAIAEEFSTIEAPAIRVIGYFISKLTQLGRIPAHEEWSKWTIAPPPWFEVDRASARIDIEDVAAGRTPMSVLHARDGHTTVEVYTSRATAYELALATQAEHPDVPLAFILGDLGRTASRVPADSGGKVDADGNPINEENQAELARIEQVKAVADAYGVGVRAGAITPTEEDEMFMRKQLGLTDIPAPAKSSWKQDKGFRRPITLVPSDGAKAPAGQPQPPISRKMLEQRLHVFRVFVVVHRREHMRVRVMPQHHPPLVFEYGVKRAGLPRD